MARNGSGTYSLPVNSWNPAQNGVPATAADWQALINDVASALTQSFSRDGQTTATGNFPMGGNKLTGLAAGSAAGDSLRFEQLFSQGLSTDLASAATTDIGAQLTTVVNITGTTTITSFGTNYNGPRFLRFAGALTLTHSATLVLPGSANITTAAGDGAIVVPLGNPPTGWRVVAYQRASGEALAPPSSVPAANLTGTVAIANGGTGATTAAAAFTNLKQAATATDTGVVELATNTEAQAGADTTRAITPATLFGGLNASGTAPIYACRAWVNFNGTGTVAIRAAGNVAGITDNGVGDYTVNFTTAMPDVNYALHVTPTANSSNNLSAYESASTARTTSLARVFTHVAGTGTDVAQATVTIFR